MQHAAKALQTRCVEMHALSPSREARSTVSAAEREQAAPEIRGEVGGDGFRVRPTHFSICGAAKWTTTAMSSWQPKR